MPAKLRRLRKLDIVVICATVLLVGFGVYSSLYKKSSDATCQTAGKQHQLTLQDDDFSTKQLRLTQCDTVRVVNIGPQSYELAFGIHDKHVTYPGFTNMQYLEPNEFFVFNAVQAGTYTMHDHLRDNAHIELDIRAK